MMKGKDVSAVTPCPTNRCNLIKGGGDFDEYVCNVCQSRFLGPAGASALYQKYLSVNDADLREIVSSGINKKRVCLFCKTEMVEVQLKGQWVDICPGCGSFFCNAGELSKVTRGFLQETPVRQPILETGPFFSLIDADHCILYESTHLPNTFVPYDWSKKSIHQKEIIPYLATCLRGSKNIQHGNLIGSLKESLLATAILSFCFISLAQVGPGIAIFFLWFFLQRPKLFINQKKELWALTRLPLPWRRWKFSDVATISYRDRWVEEKWFNQSVLLQVFFSKIMSREIEGHTRVQINISFCNGDTLTFDVEEAVSLKLKSYLGEQYRLIRS